MDKQATRRIGKGILAVGILLAMLVIATGSVSAHCNQTADAGCHGCCYVNSSDSCTWCYECGDTVTLANNGTKTCVFDQDKTCNSGHGLQVGAANIVIDGNGHTIDGSSPGACGARAGIYSYGHNNITIKNLEVKNFCYGIRFMGTWSASGWVCNETGTIDNCKVHDNGNASSTSRTVGIALKAFKKCNITNNTVYNNTGYISGSCDDGGAGIRLHTYCDNCNITNNTVYDNSLAGIYSKMICKYCNVTYNNVTGNGASGGNSFPGGIRLQCKNTNNWTVENNTVNNSYGPGIFVRGDNASVRHNIVTNSTNVSGGGQTVSGDGIHIWGGAGCGGVDYSTGSKLYNNTCCCNERADIWVGYEDSARVTDDSDENTCISVHRYNDSGTFGCTYSVSEDGTYNCTVAYKYQNDSDRPFTTNNVPNIAFNSTQYNNIRANNGIFECNMTTAEDNYAAHRFDFNVAIGDVSKVSKINATWNGKGWHDSGGNANGTYLYIWNFTSAAYEELDSTPLGTEVTLTGEKTAGISNYINSDNVTVLAEQKTADNGDDHSHIETDYVKLVVTVTT